MEAKCSLTGPKRTFEEQGAADRIGSIAGDEETKNYSLRVAALSFFRWQVCIVIGGYFHWNIYNPVQKTGAKIIDVTRSALFLFHQFA